MNGNCVLIPREVVRTHRQPRCRLHPRDGRLRLRAPSDTRRRRGLDRARHDRHLLAQPGRRPAESFDEHRRRATSPTGGLPPSEWLTFARRWAGPAVADLRRQPVPAAVRAVGPGPLMRILQVHTHYRQPGGEDAVVATEAALLRDAGHQVLTHRASNPEGRPSGPRPGCGTVERVAGSDRRSAGRTAATRTSSTSTTPGSRPHRRCSSLVRRVGVPVVMTLHNYRLVCAAATLFRDGAPCTDCVGTHPWHGAEHACYRGSRSQSVVAAATIDLHQRRGTWHRDVDRFLALTDFGREQFVAGGLPSRRIVVKSNSVDDPGPRPQPPSASDAVICLGRLRRRRASMGYSTRGSGHPVGSGSSSSAPDLWKRRSALERRSAWSSSAGCPDGGRLAAAGLACAGLPVDVLRGTGARRARGGRRVCPSSSPTTVPCPRPSPPALRTPVPTRRRRRARRSADAPHRRPVRRRTRTVHPPPLRGALHPRHRARPAGDHLPGAPPTPPDRPPAAVTAGGGTLPGWPEPGPRSRAGGCMVSRARRYMT
jgi:hypothetical protein